MRNLHCRVTFEGNVFQPVGRDLCSVSFEFLGLHFEGVLKMFLPLSLYLLLSLSSFPFITLIKCLKSHKSLGLLFEGAL